MGIPAAGDVRRSLADLFPDAWGEGLSLELVGSVGSPAPDVRAEVTDLRTGSRVDVQATRAVKRSYLPATARTVTPSGSSLATDATILNPSDSPLSVRLLFLEDDRDNGAAPVAALRLGAGESRSIEDILGTFFGVAEASGILEIEADRRVLVVFGTQTVRSRGDAGTFRSTLAPFDPDRLARTSVLTASDGRLGRIAIFNPEAAPVPAVVRWVGADGMIVMETSLVVPPRGSALAAVGDPGVS